VFGVAVVSVYFAQYARGLALAGQAAGPLDVIHDTQRLLDHHAGLTDMKNPWVSGWITWFVPVRPVMLAHTQHLGAARILTSLGNVALWWSASLTLALTVGIVLTKGIDWMLDSSPVGERSSGTLAQAPLGWVKSNGRAILLLLSGCFGFLAPWILTHRDSYIYHYLPSYMSLLLLLAGLVDSLGRSRYRALLTYVGAVLLVAAFYAPLWSTLALSPAAVPLRLFLPGWR
jgi:dolichyl-phosphate-mannose--protein O-mannosyl transferase